MKILMMTLSVTAANGSTINNPGDISWGFLLIGLLGGLALFLYGMEKMSEGLKKSAGNRMRSILSKVTQNRSLGLIVGAFVTMVIQSSSATTVMLVSFVQAGLMSFTQSLGVILGADIGTTITAQLVAFKLTDYALLMIAIGFSMTMFSKNETFKHIGESIMGFGILFFGMKIMSDAMYPLRSLSTLIDVLKELENPILGILIGAIFTSLIQSSSAFTGIVIVLAQQNLITLSAGIPLIFGANIGTCITAGLASIGANREAKRVALAHVLFKVFGVVLFIFWIPAFADIIKNFGVKYSWSTARQIANAHTIFNVLLAFVFLPFTTIFGKLILKIIKARKVEEGIKPAVWHLDNSCLKTPAIALDLARSEIVRMSKILGRMLIGIIKPFISQEEDKDEIYPQLSIVEGIEMREEKIDFLEEKVSDYLIQIGKHELTDEQTNEVYQMMSILKDMESTGDVIQKNMIPLISKKRSLKGDFSKEGKEELLIYHEKVCKQISRLKEAFEELDPVKAKKIMAKEEKYLDLESEYRVHHLDRLYNESKGTAETHEIHMDLLDLLKQINIYAGNIAKTIFKMSKVNIDKT
ncbi:MAG: Na/Pi cotransporter family protein [Acidobacteriota bacterium]